MSLENDVRVDLLKGLLAENDVSYSELAEIIGKSATTTRTKLNKSVCFDWFEMQAIRKHFNLSDERFMSIFFNK